MKYKKIAVSLLAVSAAITTAVLPNTNAADKVNAIEISKDENVFLSEDEMSIMSALDSGVAEPNVSVIVDNTEFYYTENEDGTLYIKNYDSSVEHIVFPSEIDGKKVTGVTICDYDSKKNISVTVPATVTKIGVASSTSSNLKEIIVDEDNQKYSSKDGVLFNKDFTELVRYPTGKSDSEPRYTLPNTVKSIDKFAFDDTNIISVDAGNNSFFSSEDGVLFNKDKTELFLYPRCKPGSEYTVPETVSTIKYFAFDNCKELASVILQEGLKTIEQSAFFSNTLIEQIKIPASVMMIENGAFTDMMSLKSIVVDEKNQSYFTEDGVLFNKAKTELLLYPALKEGDTYTILDTVEVIGYSAFARTLVSKVIFGKNVSVIDYGAFFSCKITEAELPESLKIIESYAFPICWNMKSIVIPSGVERIGNITEERDDYSYDGLVDPRGIIANAFMEHSNDFVIYGFPGTVAEKYAFFWGIPFNETPILSDDKNDTGVNVMLPEGAVPANTVLNVETKISEEYPNATVYDISLISGGNPVKPNGKVSVRIPIPAGASGNDFRVYYKDEKGKLTDMKAVVSGNYIVFTTDHFSEYLVTTEQLIPDTITGDVNNDQSVNDRDSISLDRYLGDWDIDILLIAADLNGDGKVNDQDSIILARTLAGWYE